MAGATSWGLDPGGTGKGTSSISDAGTASGKVVGASSDASVGGGVVDESAGGVLVVDDVDRATAVVVGSVELPVQADSTSTRASSQSGGVIRPIVEP
jgi:hypothetical protein